MQWKCKNGDWQWDSNQRTEHVHTGVKYKSYLDIVELEFHTIMFSMRDDGFELDKWLLFTDKAVLVYMETGDGPHESPIR